jgi:hypothetical protein
MSDMAACKRRNPLPPHEEKVVNANLPMRTPSSIPSLRPNFQIRDHSSEIVGFRYPTFRAMRLESVLLEG